MRVEFCPLFLLFLVSKFDTSMFLGNELHHWSCPLSINVDFSKILFSSSYSLYLLPFYGLCLLKYHIRTWSINGKHKELAWRKLFLNFIEKTIESQKKNLHSKSEK